MALTQPWHHFDEAALFYRSVLGLQPDESQDLADPYGLFRSRAVANADGSLRIALNVAPSPDGDGHPLAAHRARHGRHRRRQRAALRGRRGRAAARSPPTTTTTSTPSTTCRRRRWGPCASWASSTTGTADGEFFHFYTATLGRVFFEVVQRSGGYRGYGARNATVRLAAQHTAQHGTV